jgi:hypothetical protein
MMLVLPLLLVLGPEQHERLIVFVAEVQSERKMKNENV